MASRFGAPFTFICDVLLIHNWYLVEGNSFTTCTYIAHCKTKRVASFNISSIGMSGLPICRRVQPRGITLTAFEVPIPT